MNSEIIRYTVELENPNAHLFSVSCTIEEPNLEGQIFELPAWIPGSYMIRDFSKNIVELSAHDDSGIIEVTKHSKSAWFVAAVKGKLIVSYSVYAFDLSVRSAYFDQFRAFFNGTSLFLMPHGKEQCLVEVELVQSEFAKVNKWSVASSMRTKKISQEGFGVYEAKNYDDLIDHPFELSRLKSTQFEVSDIPHQMVFSGENEFDIERVSKDVTLICRYQHQLFGAPLPINNYLFMTFVMGDGYGGLEHRNSTSLICSRKDLPRLGDDVLSDEYRNFLALCSHEYFHTWNVKRIKPKSFHPYDLSKEVHTSLLWVFEGFTSYYDELCLLRSGVITVESYLELLGQTITRLYRSTGRSIQSVAESSFDAWTKFYKQDENAPNAIVSYYVKGAVIALLLDLTIRAKSDSQFSLDDVMRYLWLEYGVKAIGIGEDEMPAIIKRASGLDLCVEIDSWVKGVEELPLEAVLASFGVKLEMRSAQSQQDKGGKPVEGASKKSLVLGARFKPTSFGVEITHVFTDGAAENAGLAAGDQLIAIDGLRVSATDLESVIGKSESGIGREIHFFRRDQLVRQMLTPLEAPLDTGVLSLIEDLDEAILRRRNSWLSGR